MIDRFNDDNEMLNTYMYYSGNPNNINDLSDKAIKEKLGNSRGYLLKCFHEIYFNSVMLNERLSYNREKEFQNRIDSITNGSEKSIDDKRKSMFNWYSNEKKFIETEKNKLDIAFKDTSEMGAKAAESQIKEVQERKRKKSITKIDKLIIYLRKYLEEDNTKIKKTKIKKLSGSLEELRSILLYKKSFLTPSALQPLVSCFHKNRNWENIDDSKNVLYAPIPKSDSTTNQVIINFYGMITDDGTRFENILQQYVK